MASDSPPANTNDGPSSPGENASSPIGNTYSSPSSLRSRRRARSSTPSQFATPPPPSRLGVPNSTPPTSRPSAARSNRPATPSHTDEPPPSSDDGGEDGADDATPTFVWGTNISVQDVKSAIEMFVKHFREAKESSDDLFREGKYMASIRKVIEIEGEWIDVDAYDVFDYDPDLYNKMVRYPLEVLAIFDIVLMDIVSSIDRLFEKHVQVRIFNLRSSTSMRNLNPSDIEKMISLKGMIIRSSSIIPEIREAVFRCLVCGYFSDPIIVDRGKISEPPTCLKQECLAKNSMTLVHNRCRFADKQIVRLQETPDEIPEGGTPHTVSLLLHDKLVDNGKPGDRIEVTGIYRAMTVRVGPAHRTVKSVFKTYIDCLHIKKASKTRMAAEDPMDVDNSLRRVDEDVELDEEKLKKFEELSKQPDIYEKLARSLAPNIWELDDVKKGLLCQLFGGNALNLASGANFRGDINILLVGDPGTSKSQLLQYIHKLSPRGIYTSGRGSSAVGLTAYVAKDPETGETVLESGALVLSDRGICCIDEFDKMSDSARSMLHEVMEQQTVSIAKAGIIASLNARTSVLACANPSGSRYNPRLSVIENIHLPPTLLSRFDLIYLILDKPDEQTDRRLAKHIVALHFENAESAQEEALDITTLTSYVSYARKNIHPKLSDEAAEELTRGYVELRKAGKFAGSSKKVITATPRQIESLIRLSEALARMRFSEWVEKHDVEEAFRLLRVAMQQSATDHATGTIDMDLINTGVSASERMRRDILASSIRDITLEKMQIGGSAMRLSELLEELKKPRKTLKAYSQQTIMSASIAKPISATPLRFHFNRKNNISFSDCISISSGFRHSPPSSLDLVAKPPTNTRVSHLVRAQGSYDYIPDSKFYKVEAIVRPWRIQHVSSALLKIGIRGVTVSDVRGFGAQGGSKERHGGSEFSEDKFVAKVKMEIVVKKEQVESVINTIIDGARTGEIGDGKIFVLPVSDVIRVRTGERGEQAEKMTGDMLSSS